MITPICAHARVEAARAATAGCGAHYVLPNNTLVGFAAVDPDDGHEPFLLMPERVVRQGSVR